MLTSKYKLPCCLLYIAHDYNLQNKCDFVDWSIAIARQVARGVFTLWTVVMPLLRATLHASKTLRDLMIARYCNW
jgi:hypothetical protein